MKITNLTKKYDDRVVLNKLNLSLKDGKIYALMGPSGCGKTSLLHILLGIMKPDEGIVEGIQEKHISAVFQENRLFEFLTAGENVAVIQKKKQKPEEINAILREILPKEAIMQMVGEFSGGMKRRAAIARAMLSDSDMIIMDEPLTGLDEATRNHVIDFILKYRRGRTLIFSTHQEAEVELFHAEKILLEPYQGNGKIQITSEKEAMLE